VKVELLYFEGCPSHAALLPRLGELLVDAGVSDEIELRRVESAEAAEAGCFLGSPTVRVDGADVEPGAEQPSDFGPKCRLFRTPQGISPTPPEEWLRTALGCVEAS
jgi:hypothetical protein